jgi:hypothetical protein
MTVVAKGEGKLTALVSEVARPVVLEALGDYAGVAQDSLDHATAQDERDGLTARLEAIGDLRVQLASQAPGEIQLTGPEGLVVSAVKVATGIATHDLDGRVTALTTTPAPLDASESADLLARGALVTTCLETLIDCESSRRER